MKGLYCPKTFTENYLDWTIGLLLQLLKQYLIHARNFVSKG